MQNIELLLPFTLAVTATLYVVYQARKPDRWIGRVLLGLMNLSHSSFTDWGLQHVHIAPDFTILDIGCGGGRTIQKMASIVTAGKVYGVDYAAGSVAAARAKNASLIKLGRVEIQQAPVSHLPFPDNHFDLVTAIETHYYWPSLITDLQEIRRVLKPKATLIIIAESYKGGRNDYFQWPVMKLLKATRLSADEHRGMLSAAGFSEVQVLEEFKQGWICALGIKPA